MGFNAAGLPEPTEQDAPEVAQSATFRTIQIPVERRVANRNKFREVRELLADGLIENNNTVIADIWVTKEENCFPMIQSGSAHNEMLLSKDQKQDKKSAEKGKILV